MKLNHIRALGIEPPMKENEQEEHHISSSCHLSGKGESELSHHRPSTQGKRQLDSDALELGNSGGASQTAGIVSFSSPGCAAETAFVFISSGVGVSTCAEG